MKKNFVHILIIVLLSIPAILPLFHNGFFVTDDGEWMIIRFSAFHQAFRDGQFPVRFLGRLNQEYGYPVANFMYPGFMYLGEFIHVFKFGFVDTIKIIFGASLLASAVFTYLWLEKMFNKVPAFFGSLFFLYNPYHLFDIYRRGSLGEIFAIGIIPFVLWSIESKRPLLYAISVGLLIISHNTLALLFLPLIFIYMYLNNPKYYLFTLLGIGLAAFFWLPAIYDLQFTIFSKVQISNWGNYFSDINLIGTANIIIFIAAGFVLLIRKIFNPKIIFFFIITALSIFLALPLSSPVWKLLPVSFIQFPFRLLSISILGFSFLTAFLLELVQDFIKVFKIKTQLFMGSLFVFILLFYSSQYILKNEYFDKGEGYYATNMATTTVKDEYMPIWVKQKPSQKSEKKVEIVEGLGNIQNIVNNNKKILFLADINKDAIIQVNTIYWPGWNASVDGKEMDIEYNNLGGLIQLNIPKGDHKVEIIFSETTISIFSDIISILSLLILILIILSKRIYLR